MTPGPLCSRHTEQYASTFSRVYVSYPGRLMFLADVSDPASKVPIGIDEDNVQALRQHSPDRALASAAGTDQLNHRTTIDVVEETAR